MKKGKAFTFINFNIMKLLKYFILSWINVGCKFDSKGLFISKKVTIHIDKKNPLEFTTRNYYNFNKINIELV